MKKLNVPAFDRSTVRFLLSKLDSIKTAQKLWKRNDGKYKAFKGNVTATMKVAQSSRCAYCGARLHEQRPHRDHIAPKSPHYRWTFWPINLVLACYCCNVDRKNGFDTVDVLAKSYRRTTFNIVHPFLDDPADHLNFDLADKSILVQPKNASAKGAKTIELFGLMEPERAKQRAKDALLDDDIDHLHGQWRDMLVMTIVEAGASRLVMKTKI